MTCTEDDATKLGISPSDTHCASTRPLGPTMGHGASTNVKRVTLVKEGDDHNDTRPVWTRSNSDGCIVENLNTSKTKVDLLSMQLSEYKELLKAAELKQAECVERANTLEKQLAEVEGTNFELTDRISDLEQQLESLQATSGSEVAGQLEQELTLSSQDVEKLEMHIKVLEEQMASMRSKFRKKLRAAKTGLTESKQESSLKLYSLKDQIKLLDEENLKLTERLERAGSGSGQNSLPSGQSAGDNSRTMVILELSNQVSSQEDQIAELQEQLSQKEKTIAELSLQLNQERPPSRPVNEVSSSRPPSGAGNRPLSGRSGHSSSREHHKDSSQQRKGSGRSIRSRSGEEESMTERDNDFLESADEEKWPQSSRSNVDGSKEDVGMGKRVSSGNSRKGRGEKETDSGSHKRRQSSSRERRRNGKEEDRTESDDSKSVKSSHRPDSSKNDPEGTDGSHRRKRSSSRGRRKEPSLLEGSKSNDDVPGHSPDSNNGPHHTEINSLKRTSARISSAGSQDSAFHENQEEGTKSAPSSAGPSRHRHRLKAGQQRAVSLDMIDNRGSASPKPPLRTDTNLYERDSGVDDGLSKVSNKSPKTSDQDLDDLLQELMGDEGAGPKNNNAEHGYKFGISEDKIRSLLSDSTA